MLWHRGEQGRSWRCSLLGCDWETRRAYDYCVGCGASRWHIASAWSTPPAASATGALFGWPSIYQPLVDVRVRLLEVLGLVDCEGSELFVDVAETSDAGRVGIARPHSPWGRL